MTQAWTKISVVQLIDLQSIILNESLKKVEFLFLELKLNYFIPINQFFPIFLALLFPFQQFFEFLIVMLNIYFIFFLENVWSCPEKGTQEAKTRFRVEVLINFT